MAKTSNLMKNKYIQIQEAQIILSKKKTKVPVPRQRGNIKQQKEKNGYDFLFLCLGVDIFVTQFRFKDSKVNSKGWKRVIMQTETIWQLHCIYFRKDFLRPSGTCHIFNSCKWVTVKNSHKIRKGKTVRMKGEIDN